MKVLTKDRIIGATTKATNPPTLKPGTTIEANQKHKPLTTKENAPKLKIFKGRESMETTGLIPVLTAPTTKPANMAAGKLSNLTPGKMISTTKRLSAVAKTVKSEPNIFF